MLKAQQYLVKKLGQNGRELFQDIISKPDQFSVDKLKHVDPEIITNQFIYIACHPDRRSQGEKVKAISRNMLEVLRDTSLFQKDIDLVLSILISKSHILLKDQIIVQKLFDQLRQYQDRMDFKQCLHLNHIMYKLKIDDPELEKFALQKIMKNIDQLYFNEQVSYLSMESNKMITSKNEDNFIQMLDNFVNRTLSAKRYLISQKCSFQLCQTLFNIFPELVTQDYFDFDVDRSQKYGKYFDQFRHEYVLSRLLLYQRRKQTSLDFLMCEKQSNSFKLKAEKTRSKTHFEENLEQLLTTLGVEYQTKRIFAIYETDINIGNDIVIQLNGQYHFIEDLFGNIISYQPNHEMCIRHLTALKLKKLLNIDYSWWQNIDPKEKQLDFLRNELGLT